MFKNVSKNVKVNIFYLIFTLELKRNTMAKKNQNTTSDYIPFDTALVKGQKLLKNDKTKTIGLYIIVSINLGIRVSDTLLLTFEQLRGDEIEINEKKTGKRRVMAINDNIKEALTMFDESYKGLAFKSQKNTVYSTQQINRKLKGIFAKEISKGLQISSHSLRKSFGRQVYNMNNQSENALLKLSELFNHTSPSITRKYLGLRQEELNDIYLSL